MYQVGIDIGGTNIKIGLLNGEVVTAGGDFPDAIMEAMQQIEGIEDKENCLIFVGCDVDESLKDEIEARISDLCPFAEVTFMDGGQPVYRESEIQNNS